MRHWINVGTGCVFSQAYPKDMWPGCDQECRQNRQNYPASATRWMCVILFVLAAERAVSFGRHGIMGIVALIANRHWLCTLSWMICSIIAGSVGNISSETARQLGLKHTGQLLGKVSWSNDTCGSKRRRYVVHTDAIHDLSYVRAEVEGERSSIDMRKQEWVWGVFSKAAHSDMKPQNTVPLSLRRDNLCLYGTWSLMTQNAVFRSR